MHYGTLRTERKTTTVTVVSFSLMYSHILVCKKRQFRQRLRVLMNYPTLMAGSRCFGHEPLTIFFEKGAWSGSRDPLNFWALNANSCKTVKATEFKFDICVPMGQSGHDTHKFSQNVASLKIYLAEICTLTSAF